MEWVYFELDQSLREDPATAHNKQSSMYSDLECGICYRTYNCGRRCPRELHCRHSFCESCLLAMSRAPAAAPEPQPGADRSIVCPLCRQTTSISGERQVRAELRVDESALERLLVAGVLDQDEEEDDEPEVEVDGQLQDACDGDYDDDDLSAPPRAETPAEHSDSSAGTGGGRLRRTLRKVWRKIIGESPRQRNGAADCMTSEDLRNFAMMSCHMF
ncbi:hypothetical protein INR49_011889 [Caranx melampygus]|nr:hypothetical protein INR49_011889 [Caranx melampygus]